MGQVGSGKSSVLGGLLGKEIEIEPKQTSNCRKFKITGVQYKNFCGI